MPRRFPAPSIGAVIDCYCRRRAVGATVQEAMAGIGALDMVVWKGQSVGPSFPITAADVLRKARQIGFTRLLGPV